MLPKPHSPRIVLALYAAALGVLAALFPWTTQNAGHIAEGILAFVLLAAIGATIAWDRELVGRSRLVTMGGIVAFLAAIALLRNGAGGVSGYGPLVLLPVIWSALRGRRDELIVAVSGAALALVLPLIVVGGPTYPSVGWRAASLFVLVAVVLGVAILRLVERLTVSNAHAATILGAMREGLVLTRDGEIVSVNPALCEMVGLSEDALLGARPPFPFWPPEIAEQAEAMRKEVVNAGGGEFEMILMRGDGERFRASITAARAQLTDGTQGFVTTVRDITERHAHDAAVQKRSDELHAIAAVTRAVSHSSPEDTRQTICDVALGVTGAIRVGVYEVDGEGQLRNTANVGGAPDPFAIGPDQPQNATRLAFTTGQPFFVADAASSPHIDKRVLHHLHGGDVDASMAFRPISDASGTRGVLVLVWTPGIGAVPERTEPVLDVLCGEAAMAIQRADLLEQLAELSRTDELTGMPNRRAWEELLDREIRASRRTGLPLSVAMLDLDFFKAYNDHHGHQGGDRLLWLAAHLWRENLRDTDVIARWGGEEFGLLLPGCDSDSAFELIERLHELPLDGVTFSAGVAEWDGSSPAEDLIGQADAALYGAKHAGRNRTHIAELQAAA